MATDDQVMNAVERYVTYAERYVTAFGVDLMNYWRNFVNDCNQAITGDFGGSFL